MTLSVASGVGFPGTGQFRVLIDNEIMLVTAGGGTTSMTANRAQESTVIASHLNAAPVYQILTNQGLLNAVREGSSQIIAFASTITPDASAGTEVTVGTLTGAITINNATNPLGAQLLTFLFTQDGTGGRLVTWGAAYKTAFQPVQAANAVSSVTFFYDGTNWQQVSAMPVDASGNARTVGSLTVASGGISVTGSPDITMTDAASRIVPGATSLSLRDTGNANDNLLVSNAGNVTARGSLTVTGGPLTVTAGGVSITGSPDITMTDAASRVVPGATSFSVRDTGNANDNLLVSDAGAVTVRNGLTVTTGGETISAGGLTVTGSPDITMTDAASRIVPGATSFAIRDNGNTNNNLIITNAGAATVRAGLTVSAGGISVTGSPDITMTDANSRIVPGATNFSIRDTANANDNLLISNAGAATIRGGLTVSASGIVVTGSSSFANDLKRSFQSIAFSATITPSATAGEQVIVGILTGNITVNNPTGGAQGQELMFEFQQDGTGGRTVTFGNNYKVNWTPSTTASLRNTITFFFDGSAWVQKSTATGLPA